TPAVPMPAAGSVTVTEVAQPVGIRAWRVRFATAGSVPPPGLVNRRRGVRFRTYDQRVLEASRDRVDAGADLVSSPPASGIRAPATNDRAIARPALIAKARAGVRAVRGSDLNRVLSWAGAGRSGGAHE